MKWLDTPAVKAAQLGATALALVLLVLGEPQCAAALARLGLGPAL